MSRTKSAVDTDEATADEVKSVEMKTEAAQLESEAKALKAKAVGDEDEAKALEAEAAEEQLAADEAAAKVAADEAFADEEEATAVEAGAKAAMDEAEEVEDGTAIAVCEFVPFVDLVCDGLGAIAAISLQGDVAVEVAEAVSATAAAASARDDETREAVLVSEQETASVTHGNAAAVLETEADSEQAEAAADEEQAAQDQAAAEVLKDEAKELETSAMGENVEAGVKETKSGSEMKKAGQHGLQAAQKAMLSTAVGMVAVAYFGVKATTRALSGITRMVVSVASPRHGQPNTPGVFACLPSKFVRDLSYFIMHGWILLGTSVSMVHFIQPGLLEESATYDLRSRGGVILIFALLASSVHWFLLHVLQDLSQHNWCVIEWGKLIVFLVPFVAMEALVVLVTLGWTSTSGNATIILSRIPLWSVGICIFVFLFLHVFVSHHPNDRVEDQAGLGNTTMDCEEHGMTERTSLIEKVDVPSQHNVLSDASPGNDTSHRYSWNHLLIPLETLILSCLLAILVSCYSHTQVLWPLLYQWIVGGHKWAFIVIFLSYVIVVVLFTCFVARHERKYM